MAMEAARTHGVGGPCGQKLLYAASTFGHLRSFHLPYIDALVEDGYDVTLLAGGDPVAAQMPEGMRCVSAGFVKSMVSPGNFKAAVQVAALQLEEGFDVVLTHTSLAAFFVRAGIGLAALRRPRAGRPRVVNTVHGYLFDDATGPAKRAEMLLAERLCAPVTDTVVVMNRQDAHIACEHRLCRGEVLQTPGMGVDFTGMGPATPERLVGARHDLGIGSDAFVCLCVAEFSARKNQRVLIEALAGLPARVILALPGSGDLMGECQDLACSLGVSDRVFFPGQLCRAELAEWRAASDVCVSASRYEGLPFHVMEAFACGLPAVLSDVKGHEDLVEPGRTGLLYPFGNASAFASCVEDLMADPGRLAAMGADACRRAAAYALPVVLPNLVRIYEGR